MLSWFSKSNAPLNLPDLINQIKEGELDVTKSLKVSPKKFQKIDYENLMVSNPGLISEGVTEVLIGKNAGKFFNLYNHLEVWKYQDKTKYRFIVVTNDLNLIKDAYNSLGFLGKGLYDNERFTSFFDEKELTQIAAGSYQGEAFHTWVGALDNCTITLHYLGTPEYQLTLILSVKDPKSPDTTVRDRGTIKNLLTTDFSQLSAENAHKKQVELDDNGNIVFTDYTFLLQHKELSVFDTAVVRIFGESPIINSSADMNLFLKDSSTPELAKIIQLVDKLTKIYGPDNHGSGVLEPHEIENLENRELWLGRRWDLNTSHAIWHNDTADMLYTVNLSFDDEEEALSLDILGYNRF